MTRPFVWGILAGVLFALAIATAAHGQEQVPTCTTQPALVEWDVLRDFDNPRRRAVELDFTGNTAAAAVKPVYVQVARRNRRGVRRTRTLVWRRSLNVEQYVFHHKFRREVSRFLAVVVEDRSNYTGSILPREFVEIPVPLVFQGPPFNLPPSIRVPLPAQSGPDRFNRDVCARFLTLMVRR